MCHYYESTEEWQTLWLKRLEAKEAVEAEAEPEPELEPERESFAPPTDD